MDLLSTSSHPDRNRWFEARLAHESFSIRGQAVSLLIGLDPEKILDKVLPLMRDESSSVRLEVIKSCRQLLDRKAVPYLLEAMRDPRQGVRDSAKGALEAIRFYDTQKRHWDRWLEGAGYGSPGEALLKQAAADQPRRIRLAAIASLGTLGDPNALPVLIELMRSEDAEIREAAEAALQKINSRKSEDKK
ncbi:MAG: HEAT repeat domain-containing protein [Planctomycetota bacterium]